MWYVEAYNCSCLYVITCILLDISFLEISFFTSDLDERLVSAAYDHSESVHHYHIVIAHPGVCDGVVPVPVVPSPMQNPCWGISGALDKLDAASFNLVLSPYDSRTTRHADYDVSVCKRLPRRGPCSWQRGFIHQIDRVNSDCEKSFSIVSKVTPLAASSIGGAGYSFYTRDVIIGVGSSFAVFNVRCPVSGSDVSPVPTQPGSDPRLWWNAHVPAVIERAANVSNPSARMEDREFVFEFVSPCACGPCSSRSRRSWFGWLVFGLSIGFVALLIYFAVRTVKNLLEGNHPAVPHQAQLLTIATVVLSVVGFVLSLVMDLIRRFAPTRIGLHPDQSQYALVDEDEDGSDVGEGLDGLSLQDDENEL